MLRVECGGNVLAVGGIAAFATAAPYIQVMAINHAGQNNGSVAAVTSDSSGNIDLNATGAIVRYNNQGVLQGTISTSVPGNGGTYSPYYFGVAVDSSGYIWTTSRSGSVAAAFNNSGSLIYTVGWLGSGSGGSGSGSGGGSGRTYPMGYPAGVAVDASENVYVIDDGGIHIGSGSAYSTGDLFKWNYSSGGSWKTYSSVQTLSNPQGITYKNNDVWVANTGANDIIEYNSSLSVVKTISGNGLNQPYGVAIDSSGDVWVANSGANDVLESNSTGTLLTTIGGSGIFNGPQGVTIDPSGNLWVSDSNNILSNRLLEYTQTIPGDANLDGKVDINDLTIVLAHYNQTGQTWTQGEFTGDGTVDVNDLTIVLAHYNDSVSASGGGLAATPEPGTLLLVAAGVTSLLTCGVVEA